MGLSFYFQLHLTIPLTPTTGKKEQGYKGLDTISVAVPPSSHLGLSNLPPRHHHYQAHKAY